MIRILLSPLFIGLIALAIGQAIIFRRWSRFTRLERGACLLVAVATGMLLVASLPIVASLLLFSLERQYNEPTAADLAQANAVVVLEGDYVRGKDPTRDRLGPATTGRVLCGVDSFKRSGSQWLIMSGHQRPVELMRNLALQLGVLPEQILREPASRNTFEHPIRVRQLPQVSETDTVAVVTEAYHLPRAMGEFKRHFPRSIPLPCNIHAPPSVDLRQFLPHAAALGQTTAMLQEYLGMAWYAVRPSGE